MKHLSANFPLKLMPLPSNKLNTLTQSASNHQSHCINKSMNVYPPEYYSEILRYYAEGNDFFWLCNPSYPS